MLTVSVLSSGIILLGWYFYHITFKAELLDFWETCDYYYGYNEKFNILEPPVIRQTKRFNLKRLMDSIPRREKPPIGFDIYDIGGVDTGYKPEWYPDHRELGDMCNFLIFLVHWSLNESTSQEDRDRAYDIIVDFTYRYVDKIKDKYDLGVPWYPPEDVNSQNWYQFGVSAPNYLMHAMLIARTDDFRYLCAREILKHLPNPRCSFSNCRDGANQVYQALPWIAAHYILDPKNIDVWAAHPAYECVVNYIKFPMVETRRSEGLYLDGTYIAHECVLAYGYLAIMAKMSNGLIEFDDMMRNFIIDYRRVQSILFHPTLPYGPIGFFTRDKVVTCPIYGPSQYGIKVIPSCLFIRMYGDDYSFACRGQNPWIAYYEFEPANSDMGQYWVQYRGVRFSEEPLHEATFPDVGFMYQKYKDAAETILVDSLCKLDMTGMAGVRRVRIDKSDGQPDNLKYGFVFSYGNVGIMRHFYNCEELRYSSEGSTLRGSTSMFGNYSVDEFILCDYEEHVIDIYIRIFKKMAFTMILCAGKTLHEWGAFKPSLGIWHMHWDCKTRSLTSEFESTDNLFNVIEERYPKGYDVVDSDDGKSVILLNDGSPKIAMYPEGYDVPIYRNFVTRYKGKDYNFQFDQTSNQYWLSGECIDV